MVTSCPFGTSGFECSFLIYVIPAILVIGAILFRKNVANDVMGHSFSIIGSSIAGVLCYFVMLGIFHSSKWAIIVGVVALVVAGFLTAPFIGDGDAD